MFLELYTEKILATGLQEDYLSANQTFEVQTTGNQVLITENREANTLKIPFQKLV